ncbi:hypothetical protein ACQIBV_003102 [Yersinia enterocolitica]
MVVQFSDSTKQVIISLLPSPQNTLDFSNQGEVEIDDPRWAAFYDKVHMWMDGLPEPIRAKK